MNRQQMRNDCWDMITQLDSLFDGQEPKPVEPREYSIHVRMTKGERMRLLRGAAARGMTISGYVCMLISADVAAAE